jgi:hypothetical protein
MIRQRALAWAVVLALVATVQIAPVPTRFSAPVGTALAQDAPAAGAGEPTDLAVAALHCTEAPAAEALSTFLATGTPPAGCAPAVGVVVAVEEDGSALPGSPFATDVTGTLAVPVGLGSAVTANEDVKSLPPGYEPLTQEANGVPYANPVKLDSATAGAAVLFVNVPAPVAAALAQAEDTSNANAEEPVDLAVLALHCADAPAEDALAALFATGTPPTGCAPAVGVAVAVEEDNEQLSGSPFRTDVDGTLAIRIGVGSEVTVKEDPKSLPSGYVPLTQEANGVPYANPVQLDSAVAGTAVLFVNVPSSVAAKLGQGTSTVDAGEATELALAVTRDRTACDPAYPDERTCIAPGLPLAEPCSITDQRNFTVLSPDPRGLDTNGNGIGCEPISPNGGTVNHGGGFNLYTSSTNLRRAYPARTGDLAVAASHVDSGDGVWVLPPQGSRADTWFVHRDRNSAGLWSVAPGRNSTSNLAVVSNPVFIGNGHWTWPNRHDKEDWFWRSRNHAGIRFWPSSIRVGNLTIAASGSGNVAVASNPIVISNGVWVWPNGSHSDAWRWRNHISVSNLTIARSGTGNLAIVSNPIVISHGLRAWPGQINDDWFWREGNRADDRLWSDNVGKDDWFWRGKSARAGTGGIAVCNANGGAISLGDINSGGNRGNTISVGNTYGSVNIDGGTVINRTSIDLDANGGYCRADASGGTGNLAVVSNPVFVGSGSRFWPISKHDSDRIWHDRNRHDDRSQPHHVREGAWFWPNRVAVGNLAIARSGFGSIAIASNPIVIGSGRWTWPGRTRFGNGHWFRVGNLTIARSGSGSLAVVSNPVVIGGVWVWPNGSHSDAWRWRNHISVSNLTIARSGTGNLAIVSNPIVISHGLWFVSPDHSHKDDWILRGDRSRTDDRPVDAGSVGADVSDVELLTINGGLVEPSPAASIEPSSESSGQPPADSVQPSGDGKIAALTINDGPAVEPSVDGSLELPSNTGGGLPTDANAGPPSDVIVAPPADAAGSPDSAAPDAGYVDPGVDAGYPAQQSVDPGYVAPDPGYAEPAVDPSIDPGYVAPDPGYVASDPGYTPPEPNYVDPGYVDPGIAAPGPSNEVPDPVYIAPEPNYKQPEQVYTQEPTSIDPGTLAQDSGMNLGNVAPDPGNYVDPNAGFGNVDLGIDPGYVDPGNGGADSNYVAPGPGAGPANVAPDPSFDAGVGPSNVDLGGDPGGNSGNIAPNPDAGLGEQDRGGDNG